MRDRPKNKIQEEKTMQTSRVFLGAMENKECGRTIDQMINDALAEMPGMRLAQAVVLEVFGDFCTLLCVFEKNDQEEK